MYEIKQNIETCLLFEQGILIIIFKFIIDLNI